MIFGRKTANGISACCALYAVAHAAAAVAAQWGPAALMEKLARQGPRESAFVEEKHVSLLDRTLTLKGTLRYDSPTSLEKIIREPRAERYTISGDTLTVVRGQDEPRRIRLPDHPPLHAFINSLRYTLSGDLPALEQHYELRLSGTSSHWELQLIPENSRLGDYIEEILIHGSGGRIERFEFRETSGDHSILRLDNSHD
jgi:hypothetical protein